MKRDRPPLPSAYVEEDQLLHEARYWLHVFTQDSSHAELLEELLPEAEVQTSWSESEGKYVLTLSITPELDVEAVSQFVERAGVEPSAYNVRASLLTEYVSGSLWLPKHVLALSRTVGGELRFTYTVI